jgi:hypothetical protein
VGGKETIYPSSKKAFHNAVVFKTKGVEDDGRVLGKQSVKIFCNGNMHITGVRNLCDALYLADVFSTIVELIYGGNGAQGFFEICDYQIQLINFYLIIPTTKENTLLDLNKVCNVLKCNTPYFVSYNTERHAGVIVKAVDFTLMVFDSLNVLISSIKNVEQLVIARDFIKSHVFTLVDSGCCLDESYELICPNPKRNRHKNEHNKFDYGLYIMLR